MYKSIISDACACFVDISIKRLIMKRVCLLISLSCLAADALAVSVASSSLNEFSYSLSSLGDSSSSPMITWGEPAPYNGYSWVTSTSYPYDDSSSYSSDNPSDNMSSSTSSPIGNASSSLNGNEFIPSLELNASGYSAGGNTLWDGTYYGAGSSIRSFSYTLSAMSQVTFSAQANTATEVSSGIDYTNEGFEYAVANTWIRAEAPDSINPDLWQSVRDQLIYRAGYTLNGSTLDTLITFNISGLSSQLLEVTIYNYSNEDLSGQLFTSTEAYGYSSISAVPIPSALWLFGSGLIGLVGLASRKV